MTVPGFPGLTFRDIFHPAQQASSLPFPLNVNDQCINDQCSKKHENELLHSCIATSMYYYYFFARNGIYHGLRYFGIQPGDEVLMPELNSTIEPQVVRALCAKPIFYKIKTISSTLLYPPLPSSNDFTPDWDDVKSKLTSRTKVFHLIHYLGVPNDLDRALEFCKKHHLIFFEDAAYGFLSASYSSFTSSTSPLGSFGDFSILCPRKTIPVPNGGILVINTRHETRDTNSDTCSMPRDTCRTPFRARYSSLWDWQYLLRNNASLKFKAQSSKDYPLSEVEGLHKRHSNESWNQETMNKKQKGLPLLTTNYSLLTLVKRLLKDPYYIFHASGTFNPKHINWGMTKMAYNQLFKFDYPTIIQKNLENYRYVRDFCVNHGWDIFPREILPGTVPNAILLRVQSDFSKYRNIQSYSSSTSYTSPTDTISQNLLSRGVQLARPWHWNENLTTLKDIPSVDAYSGRGLILPIHYQLTRGHLDYYLSLLSDLLGT